MNYNDLTNPYDFANPVTELNLFAGRKNELNDIDYYLKHGSKSLKPINLSLTDDRASGKTSLLNMIELKAQSLDYITVRVNLDEGDSKSELSFFFKVFDSLINSIMEDNHFGGFSGAIFEEYLNQTSAFEISKDIARRPFLFPVQYAIANKANNNGIIISESNFVRDLVNIIKKVNKPIIILFDECNVLSENRIILEKLRNIFMNLNKYMIVFTGTNELFPVIDDIFSPIIRQFKKIYVKEFNKIDDTNSCVNKPLIDIGLDPESIFNSESLDELHSISEGKPYEIQLICHNMFRRLQEDKNDKMELDHSVLEDVRVELETSQDLENRPKLLDIKSLSKEDLKALNYLSNSLGKNNLKDILDLEYSINNESRIKLDTLSKSADFFIEKEILIKNTSGKLNFFGDDFDKLYTKYYAREKGINFNINTYPLYFNYLLSINKLLDINHKYLGLTSIENSDFENSLNYLLGLEYYENKLDEYLEDVYGLLFRFHSKPIHVKILTINHDSTMGSLFLFSDNIDEVKKIDNFVVGFKNRLEKVQSKLSIHSYRTITSDVPSSDVLTAKILHFENIELNKSIIQVHDNQFPDEHMEHNSELALAHCNSIEKIVKLSDHDLNKYKYYNSINVGYVYLCNGVLDKAEYFFKEITKKQGYDEMHQAIRCYNLGILHIMKDEGQDLLKEKMLECIKYA